MLRGPERWVVAVRRPDGRIGLMVQSYRTATRHPIARLVLIRGVVVAWEAVRSGFRGLAESAAAARGEYAESPGRAGSRAGVLVASIVMLAVAVGLFFVLPLIVAQWLVEDAGTTRFWMVEGAVRLGMLIGYLIVIGLIPDVRRMMQYHSAEHMVIHAYEQGAPLTSESVASQSRYHPRCSAGFFLIVIIAAVIVFAAIGDHAAWILVASRIAGIPVIAAVAYEIVRAIAGITDTVVGRALAAPLLAVQLLTTRCPSEDQVEVACVGMRRLLGVDPHIADTASRAQVLA